METTEEEEEEEEAVGGGKVYFYLSDELTSDIDNHCEEIGEEQTE